MSEVLKTERLTLRPVQMSDAEAMVVAVDDIEVSRWLTHVPHPYVIHDAQDFISRTTSSFPSHAAIDVDGKFAGMISAASELGYWIGKPYWGQGIVLEAAEAMLSRYFADPVNTDIGSGYILGNNRSRKILEILGFANLKIERAVPMSTGIETDVQKMTLSRARWTATS